MERLTTSQAARIAGLSAARIRQLLRSGELPATQTPLGALIARADLEALITRRAGDDLDGAA